MLVNGGWQTVDFNSGKSLHLEEEKLHCYPGQTDLDWG